MRELTLLSLFDGSGGFPLVASMCGIRPVACAEVEPYPIAVTKSRFPNMKHLGSVTDINGGDIEPVDIITFGSPCQDLSVAGKRAGLKHEANGDEETTRSGLFMEAVRIIKEMREATNGEYPTFAVWENVPGAFSSNKGEDFRTVLEELIKIVEPTAVMPAVPKNGWPYADSYCGDGWSLAYRTYDAQYWGVPQRRRRIYLVLDLRGQRAGKVSFEREGVRGNFAEGRTTWKAVAGDATKRTGAYDCEGIGLDLYNHAISGDKAVTLTSMMHKGGTTTGPTVAIPVGHEHAVAYTMKICDENILARGNGDGQTVSTLTGDHENRITDYTTVICLQGNGIDRADTAGCNGKGWKEDTSYTLNTIDRPAVVYCTDIGFFNSQEEVAPTLFARPYKDPHLVSYPANAIQYIVRRLTPTESARLQGFPDDWGYPDYKEDFTDEEYRFWLNVRNTHAAINGKLQKDYTKAQMLTWYNKLHTDSSEYKMWGNGISLPTALYVMQGIAEALKGGAKMTNVEAEKALEAQNGN